MKDYNEEQIRSKRPHVDVITAIQFCLDNLFSDNKIRTTDIVAGSCTYKELIGALILAEDKFKER